LSVCFEGDQNTPAPRFLARAVSQAGAEEGSAGGGCQGRPRAPPTRALTRRMQAAAAASGKSRSGGRGVPVPGGGPTRRGSIGAAAPSGSPMWHSGGGGAASSAAPPIGRGGGVGAASPAGVLAWHRGGGRASPPALRCFMVEAAGRPRLASRRPAHVAEGRGRTGECSFPRIDRKAASPIGSQNWPPDWIFSEGIDVRR